MRLAVAAVALAVVACGDSSPRAHAQRIGALEDTIGGPHAVGRIGDFLLENDQIRLVIADTGVTSQPGEVSTYGRVNTTYGGTLVDADLVRIGAERGHGNDQLAELLPGFLFSVINPTNVCIPVRATGNCPTDADKASGAQLADGSDGRPAEVMVVGTGGDLLQMVSLLNTGLLFPANLELRNIYRLAPGKKYVEIESIVKNNAPNGGAHPFPYLNPSELDNLLGGLVPNLPIRLSVPMGQLPLFGGEQELFAPGVAGFNVKFAIEDTYPIAGGFPAFPGMAVDFLATKGEGVSYGLAIPNAPSNYVSTYASGYPMQDLTPYSMVVPFTYAGVAGVFMANPPAQLAAGEQFSFTSYFIVGRGDVASVAETIYDLRDVPLGTFGGTVIDALTSAPVVKASVVVLDNEGGVVNQIETDEHGAFVARIPAGTYSYQIIADDRTIPTPRPLTITPNERTGVLVTMDPPATLVVSVLDEQGRAAPTKIQLVGNFAATDRGKDPRDFLYSFQKGEGRRVTAFDGGTRFIERAYWTKDGTLTAHVRPGTYEVVATRGPEYEITSRTVTLTAGRFTAEQLRLAPAYTSPGWVAGDFHIHSRASTDSDLPIEQRVISCAAEGLEVAVATDHNFITDYAPVIASSGLDPWLLGIPGVELTTFEMGHFNGYPLRIDRGSTRGGEFAWANQAPQKLFDQLRALAVDPEKGIVQINHPRQTVLGYFASFFIDPATAAPYTPDGILGVFAPYGEEFSAASFSYDFDAIELITGNKTENVHSFVAPTPLPPGPFPDPQPVSGQVVVGTDGRPKFPGVVETWFTLLDRGHRATGMGTSDSHHLLGDEPGYARTLLYVGEGKDTPGGVSRDDVIDAIRAHRAITTNAPFLAMTVDGQGMIGDTVRASGGGVDVRIRVRAPSWAKVDRLKIYTSGGALVAGGDIAIPAAQGTDFETVVRVPATRDTWVVAEATGTQNMFPVVSPVEFPPLDATVIITAVSAGLDLSSLPIASNLKPVTQHVVTPFAITNPIWIDADGNGTWTPPSPPLARAVTPPGPRPDVRTQFANLPEVSP